MLHRLWHHTHGIDTASILQATNTNAFQIQPVKSFSSINPLRPPQPRPVHPPLNSNLEFLSHCLSFNKNSLASTCTPLSLITWLCALKIYHSQQVSPLCSSAVPSFTYYTPPPTPRSVPSLQQGPDPHSASDATETESKGRVYQPDLSVKICLREL